MFVRVIVHENRWEIDGADIEFELPRVRNSLNLGCVQYTSSHKLTNHNNRGGLCVVSLLLPASPMQLPDTECTLWIWLLPLCLFGPVRGALCKPQVISVTRHFDKQRMCVFKEGWFLCSQISAYILNAVFYSILHAHPQLAGAITFVPQYSAGLHSKIIRHVYEVLSHLRHCTICFLSDKFVENMSEKKLVKRESSFALFRPRCHFVPFLCCTLREQTWGPIAEPKSVKPFTRRSLWSAQKNVETRPLSWLLPARCFSSHLSQSTARPSPKPSPWQHHSWSCSCCEMRLWSTDRCKHVWYANVCCSLY